MLFFPEDVIYFHANVQSTTTYLDFKIVRIEIYTGILHNFQINVTQQWSCVCKNTEQESFSSAAWTSGEDATAQPPHTIVELHPEPMEHSWNLGSGMTAAGWDGGTPWGLPQSPAASSTHLTRGGLPGPHT